MNDKELLELAAKAAGLTWSKSKEITHDGLWVTAPFLKTYWNPLTDDGDALRLAVRLTLEVDVCLTGIAVRTPIGHKVLIDSKQEPNAYAAARRAIVRAAAEIGKAK